jgi:hypothetical protein
MMTRAIGAILCVAIAVLAIASTQAFATPSLCDATAANLDHDPGRFIGSFDRIAQSFRPSPKPWSAVFLDDVTVAVPAPMSMWLVRIGVGMAASVDKA